MIGVYFFLLCFFVNLLCVVLKKESYLLAILFWLCIWIIAVFSYDVADYTNYENGYLTIANSTLRGFRNGEIGYFLFCKLFAVLGMSFSVARGSLISISLLLLLAVTKKIDVSPNLSVLLFAVYPLFIDLIQIRTLFAMSLLICGIVFGLKQNNKRRFVFFWLLSLSIHISFLVYGVLLFHDTVITKKWKIVMYYILIAVFCIAFYFGGRHVPFLSTIISISGGSERFEYWLTSSGNMGFLFFFVLTILAIGNSYIAYKHSEDSDFAILVYKINILSLCFLPFYMLASTFGRLISNLSYVNYLQWVGKKEYRDKAKKGSIPFYKVVLFLGTVLYLAIWIYLELYSSFETRVIPFFTNNIIFGL